MDDNKNTVGSNTKMSYDLQNLAHSLKGQAIINQAPSQKPREDHLIKELTSIISGDFCGQATKRSAFPKMKEDHSCHTG